MSNISNKSLMILVMIAVVSSIVASSVTIVTIDKIGNFEDFYQKMSLSILPDKTGLGHVNVYIEPEPDFASGEVQLIVR